MNIEWQNAPLTGIPLNRRALKALKAAEIHTVGELLTLSEDDLYRIPRLGKVTQKHIMDVLAANGLHLKEVKRRAEQPICNLARVIGLEGPVICPSSDQSGCRKCPYLVICTIRKHRE